MEVICELIMRERNNSKNVLEKRKYHYLKNLIAFITIRRRVFTEVSRINVKKS